MIVALATLAATIQLYFVVPKGFFPVQDTGVIMGISEAPQDISFEAMAKRQLALNRDILKDEAVKSLSSFIGIDGTNTTMNSGRIQINLKPLDERKISATEVIRRLQPRLAEVEDITLFMQPIQDLTVETRVSRTQYQYSLEDPDAKELGEWARRFVGALQQLPQLRDVASDQQNAGRVAHVVIDRDTASRLGVTPQMIDDALYDAFGQRQISIMFTQLNQYRLVLEVKPDPTPLELAEAKRQVQLRQVDMTNLDKQRVRQEAMVAKQLISRKEFEDFERQYDEAQLQSKLAKERLALLESGRIKIENTELILSCIGSVKIVRISRRHKCINGNTFIPVQGL